MATQKVISKLAWSQSRLLSVQIDDLAGCDKSVNIPGTHIEYPNWRRKIFMPLSEIFDQPELFKKINQN